MHEDGQKDFGGYFDDLLGYGDAWMGWRNRGSVGGGGFWGL